jgi:hypothetical protein
MKLALEDALPWIETVKKLAQIQEENFEATNLACICSLLKGGISLAY